MKRTIVIAALALTACGTLTENQKKGWKIAASVVVVGALAANGHTSNSASPGPVGQRPSCSPQPNGSCR